MKYILDDNKIYTKHIVNVLNRSYSILNEAYDQENKSIEYFHDVEEAYLFLMVHDNLGHFFHDHFFHFYYIFRKNKKKCFFLVKNKFYKDFIASVIEAEYLIFLEPGKIYGFNQIFLVSEGRDLRSYSDFKLVCKEIREQCFRSNNVSVNRTQNILYARQGLARKRLLNINEANMQALGYLTIDLAKLSFSELLALLATAKTFIYVVGAGVFNLLFLDKDVYVLEINPFKENSWAKMFGLSDLCNFSTFISNNLVACDDATQLDSRLDSHIILDEALFDEFKKIINTSS